MAAVVSKKRPPTFNRTEDARSRLPSRAPSSVSGVRSITISARDATRGARLSFHIMCHSRVYDQDILSRILKGAGGRAFVHVRVFFIEIG